MRNRLLFQLQRRLMLWDCGDEGGGRRGAMAEGRGRGGKEWDFS